MRITEQGQITIPNICAIALAWTPLSKSRLHQPSKVCSSENGPLATIQWNASMAF